MIVDKRCSGKIRREKKVICISPEILFAGFLHHLTILFRILIMHIALTYIKNIKHFLIYSMEFFFFSFLFLFSEAHQSNAHLSRLICAYRPPLKSKTTQSTTAPALLTSLIKRTRRMSPSNRSKSPPKVARQADSSPKRPIINDTINTERLKLARDEAERAMKVRNPRKK
jgi:hypothetical protein